ncbi:MAG: hypothetical protein AUG51_25425 [Acidobacteria bacterium 13_1_20CM_3_53_8]|nr:MAG: hypothetical protein AUG51_25425 [Acidobacteria bacterium 13_1_20CM_3_53_8]
MSKRLLTLYWTIFFLLFFTPVINRCIGQTRDNRDAQIATTIDQAAELAEAARLNTRAVELFGQSRYDEALPLAQRALEIRKRYLPPDDNLILVSSFNLAEILFAKKKYGDAMTLYKQLLSSYERKFGPNDSRIAPVLDRLAFLYYERGEFDKTESSYKRALAIDESAYGAQSAEVAGALHQLAQFYRLRGKNSDAEATFNRAIALQTNLALQGVHLPQFERTMSDYYCFLYQNEHINLPAAEERASRFRQASGNQERYSGIVNGRALSLPAPDYPVEARAARMSGIVIIKVTIDENGRVIKTEDMCGGYEPLIRAASGAAQHARFTPTLLFGQPVKVTGTIIYRFVGR